MTRFFPPLLTLFFAFLLPLSAQEYLPENIPDWAKAQIAEALARFEQWKGDDEVIVFPIVTDIHDGDPAIYDPIDWGAAKMHTLFAQYAAGQFRADFLADLGDIGLDSKQDERGARLRIAVSRRLYKNCPVPVLFALGNHDHNNSTFYVTSQLFGEQFNGWQKEKGVNLITGPNQDYGYYDLPEKKCRVFFLNTSDEGYYGYSTDQLRFLADNLRLPEGFSALVVEHFCVYAPIGYWKSYADTRAKRDELMMKILEDFASGGKGTEEDVSWDFTENKGTALIGLFCGDSHFDNQACVNGVHYIITQGYGTVNPKELPDGAVIRPFKRDETMLIDVVAVKPRTRQIHLFRIGSGGADADREFSY
ncbi:MAG: metallophosphoesterase [Thermoguttaceae bacterium]|nr:metallophosphoesterase [Thermoguttaceae bacterium]